VLHDLFVVELSTTSQIVGDECQTLGVKQCVAQSAVAVKVATKPSCRFNRSIKHLWALSLVVIL